MKRIAFISLVLAAGLLSGCATTWLVDSQVQTFSSLPAIPANAAYRFERLPSQQSYGEQQARLEAIAQQALNRVGLRRDDAATRYSVQIGARAQREASPWQDTWPGMGGDYVVTATGQLVMMQPFMRPELPWFRREVSLLIRDLGSNQIVYETHAVHEGRWADSVLVLPAMYDAALRDFPQATQGVKKVEITVPLR
jgi:hypothetical protein